MEVDPSANEGGNGGSLMSMLGGGAPAGEGGQQDSFLKDIMASVPGIDEATSFGEVIKSLDEYKFDLIIFDTAPTGHTLRLLNFPTILEKGLLKLMELKDKFGGMLNQATAMMGG
jgi:arsenite-transporting ATPase